MRGVIVGVMVLLLAVPAVGDATTVSAKKPPAKSKVVCKTKKVKVKGKTKKKRVCVRRKTTAKKPAGDRPQSPAPAPAPAPDPGPSPSSPPPAAPPPSPPPAAKGETTRDDEAGRSLVAQDLLIERFEGGNVSHTYYRLFLYANGQVTYSIVDWNSQSGEICRSEGSYRGTWSFKEGYRVRTADGRTGRAVVITTPKGDEVLAALDGDERYVYVGRNETQFERNPNMRNSC